MKSLKKPPPGVDDVTAVVLILLDSNPKDKSWAAATRCMNNVDRFLERLKSFKPLIDEGQVPAKSFEAVRSYLELPHFTRYAEERCVKTENDLVAILIYVCHACEKSVVFMCLSCVQGIHWRQVQSGCRAV